MAEALREDDEAPKTVDGVELVIHICAGLNQSGDDLGRAPFVASAAFEDNGGKSSFNQIIRQTIKLCRQ